MLATRGRLAPFLGRFRVAAGRLEAVGGSLRLLAWPAGGRLCGARWGDCPALADLPSPHNSALARSTRPRQSGDRRLHRGDCELGERAGWWRCATSGVGFVSPIARREAFVSGDIRGRTFEA